MIPLRIHQRTAMCENGASSRKLYGLLGHPLGHSFSAAYFRRKFQQGHFGEAVYENFDFADLKQGVDWLKKACCLQGFNVTIPYKKEIVPYLDGLSDEAAAIGAVNVVEADPCTGRWIGHNTDAIGFWESFQDFLHGLDLNQGVKVLILGNGGASQAVQYALARHGILYDLVCRPGHGPENSSNPAFSPQQIWDYGSLREEVVRNEFSVIVNTTSLGMFPHVDAAPSVPYQALDASRFAFDLIYNPEETLFLKRCRAQGARIRNGLDMLHRQAEAAWRIWTAWEIP